MQQSLFEVYGSIFSRGRNKTFLGKKAENCIQALPLLLRPVLLWWSFQIFASLLFSSPEHPLCISACNEWRVPLHFPAFHISTVFPWSLLQLYLSYPSLPLLQTSHVSLHMGALWEGKPGRWSPSHKQLCLRGRPCYLCPWFFWAALSCWLSGTAVWLLVLITVSTMQCFSLAAWTLRPSSHEFVHRVLPAF